MCINLPPLPLPDFPLPLPYPNCSNRGILMTNGGPVVGGNGVGGVGVGGCHIGDRCRVLDNMNISIAMHAIA